MYSPKSATSASSRRAGSTRTRGAGPGFTDVETTVVGGGRDYGRAPRYRPGLDYRAPRHGGYTAPDQADVQDYDAYEDHYDEAYGNEAYGDDLDDDLEADLEADYGDDEVYEYRDEIDRRWIWVAGVAGAILLVAVICTVVILGGGDSGSVSKTVSPPITSAAPTATATAPPVLPSATPPVAPPVPLSPETITTVAPNPTASIAPPAPAAAAPAPPATNTVTYQVTGTRQMIDLVTVVYTDQQGALQTEFNVALPWSRTVALDPGVALTSVTATSLTGQLNCSITDATGTMLVAQAANSIITTCTR